MLSVKSKSEIISELTRRAGKLKASQEDWQRNWKRKDGPLKGVPAPQGKREGGRV